MKKRTEPGAVSSKARVRSVGDGGEVECSEIDPRHPGRGGGGILGKG